MDANNNTPPNLSPNHGADPKADPEQLVLNDKFRDSTFRAQFGDKKNFLSLYNAVKRTDYKVDIPMEDVTLTNALTMGQVNDISYLIDNKLVAFFEHQSTVNNNMTLRMFMYAGRVFEIVYRSRDIYKGKAIEIADAEFYVIYNGTQALPECTVLRLSDMRSPDKKNNEINLEVVVRIYNIYGGQNQDLLNRCQPLLEYETFVELLNKYRAETGGDKSTAIRMAVAECKKRGILTNFLQTYASEVENMVMTQWNFEDAKAVWMEEGREEGREEGWEGGRDEALTLVDQGYSTDEIRKMRSQKTTAKR